MRLKSCFLLLLYFGLTSKGVYAENDNIKKGMYPYMAFIYYSDPLVVDVSGQRFLRSAVLIRPEWLVTSAIGPSLLDRPNGFPKKTLLARAGAITIDNNFTLNEDEDEQEQEIIQIVRPHNQSATQWWTTDISLLKTLLPFNMTSVVGITPLNSREDNAFNAKTCIILVYARTFANTTEDKTLMMLFVEQLPPSLSNCGRHFVDSSMICAADGDNKDTLHDPKFCQGNSGGPLICENTVIGLQTYIDNNCEQPHLYQLLNAWDNFITCGIEDKCQEENCANICDVIYKDQPRNKEKITSPVTQHYTSQDIVDLVSVPSTTTLESMTQDTTTQKITTQETTLQEANTQETTTEETTTQEAASTSTNVTISTLSEHSEEQTASSTSKTEVFATGTTLMSTDSSTLTMPTKTSHVTEETNRWPKVKETESTSPEHIMKVKSTAKSVTKSKLTWLGDPTMRSMPEETVPSLKSNVIPESQRKTKELNIQPWLDDPNKVEPQIQINTEYRNQYESKSKKKVNASNRNICVIQTLLFGFIVLLCL